MKVVALLSVLFLSSIPSFAQSWFASSAPMIQLSVSSRSRPATEEKKKVVYRFEVTNTETKDVFTATVSGKAGKGVSVFFPGGDDGVFHDAKGEPAFAPDNGGTYTMKCIVDNKVIASGKFVIPVADMEFQY